MNPWLMALLGWAIMVVVMIAMWIVQRRTGDAGIVDVAWTLGVGLLGACFALGSMDGDPSRRVVVAVLALAWSLRLGWHILRRVMTMPEDGRYQALKANWGSAAQARLFRFYQFQAAGAVLFALPMLLASQGTSPLSPLDYAGIAIWCVAIGGEWLADRQLARFRADPTNRGQVCRSGLWHYSRHPNYFFEWLHWWSYVCLAAAAPYGWLTILGPLAMLYFILRVTGIPPTEAQSLRSRGEAYRAYQRTTSAFFPWFPKRESTAA